MAKTTVLVICGGCGGRGHFTIRSTWPKSRVWAGTKRTELCSDCGGNGLLAKKSPDYELEYMLKLKGLTAPSFAFPRESEIIGRWPGLHTIATTLDHTPPPANRAAKVVLVRTMLSCYQIAYVGERVRLIGGATMPAEEYRSLVLSWYTTHKVVQPRAWNAGFMWPDPLTFETARALFKKPKEKEKDDDK